MFVRLVALGFVAAVGACTPNAVQDRLTGGLAADRSAYVDACTEWDDWDKAAPPVHIHGSTYLVGTCGITALLIATPAGHFLLDGTTAGGAAVVAANIEALGFEISDIRYILTSHEHFDHVAGVAELQRRSGATLIARSEARRTLESGILDPADPQAGLHDSFPGADVGRLIGDGETVSLGNVTLTATATPGHSPGSTSWSWQSCEGEICLTVVYADSISAVSGDDYRYSDHPGYVAAFGATLARIASLECDLMLTTHPSAANLRRRIGGEVPLVDPHGCARYAENARQRLDRRLAEENAAE